MIKVLIVQSSALYREGLRCLLSRETDIQCVGSTGDGEEAIELTCRHKPDIVIIGTHIQRIDGPPLIRKIKSVLPEASIIVLSSTICPNLFEDLIAGADSFLLSDISSSELIQAIHAISRKDGVLHFESLQAIRARLAGLTNNHSIDQLNEREMAVLTLIACGNSNKEIAFKLDIAERTVGAHISAIYSKLAVNSRVKAVLEALRKGLVNINECRT